MIRFSTMFSEKGEKRPERERERISLAFRPAGGSPPVGGNPWVVGFGASNADTTESPPVGALIFTSERTSFHFALALTHALISVLYSFYLPSRGLSDGS